MYAIGISAFYHDSAVALAKGSNTIFAAQEERFTRLKGDSSFPVNSFIGALDHLIKDFRDTACENTLLWNIPLKVVYYESFYLKLLRSLYIVIRDPSLIGWLRLANMVLVKNPLVIRNKVRKAIRLFTKANGLEKKVSFRLTFGSSKHHLSHALSAHGVSKFNNSIGLVIDGVGEIDTLSLWYFEGNQYRKLDDHVSFPNSLGLFYALITTHLGFKVNSGEYKVMGLAPYGKKTLLENLRNIIPRSSRFPFFKLNHKLLCFTSSSLASPMLATAIGFKKRKEESNLLDIHLDTAASLQAITEESIEKILQYISEKYPGVPLTYSGGVALNCKANRLIPKYFKNHFIQPAANDSGGAIGASLLPIFTHKRNLKVSNNCYNSGNLDFNPFLGSDIKNSHVELLLKEKGCIYHYMSDKELALKIASLIYEKNLVIGVCRGRMEFGPRALGNRSIICDPRLKTNQSKINKLVKKREDFRPFAPCVLEEYASDFFDGYCDKYMLTTATAKNSKSNYFDVTRTNAELVSSNHVISDISSVVHVDLSARVQIVSQEISPFLYDVLLNFYNHTKVPILVNTSFNQRGEPIVCSALDALDSFLSIGLDVLVLGNFLLYKTDNKHLAALDRNFALD